MAKKKWEKVGTLRKSDKGVYIKMDEGFTIFKDGKEIPLNDKRIVQLQDPRKSVDVLEEKGFIDEAEAEKRRARLEELDWLKFELVIPPPQN